MKAKVVGDFRQENNAYNNSEEEKLTWFAPYKRVLGDFTDCPVERAEKYGE